MPSLQTRQLEDVQNTFSSWDQCMTQAYCKWPAIVGIIVGSLIVISIIWCCARCLCCGVECCCGCCSCFNRCCPSPRNKDKGYQQPPAQPYGYGNQYASPAPPMYGAGAQQWGGYRGPQAATYDAPRTATFESASKKQPAANYNEDSLPAMPSWGNATSRHELVEDDDVEMKKMDQHNAQSQPFLASGAQQTEHSSNGRYYNAQDAPPAGDLGTMQASPYQQSSPYQQPNQYQQAETSPYQQQPDPYHEYDQHQQFVTSPVSTMGPPPQNNYPPTYRSYVSPQSTVYEPDYAPSIPPSYHTAAPPTPASPPPGLVPGGGYAPARKPVQGTYRDV